MVFQLFDSLAYWGPGTSSPEKFENWSFVKGISVTESKSLSVLECLTDFFF